LRLCSALDCKRLAQNGNIGTILDELLALAFESVASSDPSDDAANFSAVFACCPSSDVITLRRICITFFFLAGESAMADARSSAFL
jgi:hypothetical protein